MISDSVPWKEDLLKIAKRLKRKKRVGEWTERASYQVERDVMVGAYSVRKLKEANKLSDRLDARSVEVRRHALIGAPPDIWTRFDIWDFYDLTVPGVVSLSMSEFCNQIVHSWVWMISANEDGFLDGIFVSSDRQRRKSVYFFPVDNIIDLFDEVGSEDLYDVKLVINDDGEYVYAEKLGRRWEP